MERSVLGLIMAVVAVILLGTCLNALWSSCNDQDSPYRIGCDRVSDMPPSEPPPKDFAEVDIDTDAEVDTEIIQGCDSDCAVACLLGECCDDSVCGDQCVDLRSDRGNCGECGAECGAECNGECLTGEWSPGICWGSAVLGQIPDLDP